VDRRDEWSNVLLADESEGGEYVSAWEVGEGGEKMTEVAELQYFRHKAFKVFVFIVVI